MHIRRILIVLLLVPLLVLLLVAALIGSLPARAQDGGLSDEQLALIDRVVQAHSNMIGYRSYVQEAHGSDKEIVTISLLDETRSFVRTVTWTQTATQIEDGKNIDVEVSATVSETPLGSTETASYTVNAEARVVEGVLYVKAAYAPPAPDQVPLPEGWAIVDDPAHEDIYEYLQLDTLLEHSPLYGNAALLKASASDVTVEAQTLDDGTPVDVITLFFDRDGYKQILREMRDEDSSVALSEMMLEALSANSHMKMILTLGSGDTPFQFEAEIVIEVIGIDAHALSPDEFAEGIKLDVVSEQSRTQVHSHFNEPFEPVTVPDEFAS
jgi:hypothetical protein